MPQVALADIEMYYEVRGSGPPLLFAVRNAHLDTAGGRGPGRIECPFGRLSLVR